MTVSELLTEYELRAVEAEEIGSTAPLGGLYRKVISEVEELDGVATRSDTPDQWLTVKEIVEITHYSRSYIYDMIKQDKLPFVRKNGGRAIRGSRRGLRKWMESR